MTLTELQTFLAIIESGSLVRAAQNLNVTQSTVTARLKSLESELGQALMHRHRSGVTLTGAGERLRRYADTITDLWQQARQEAALPGRLSAVCNIGCHPDLWQGRGAVFFDHIRAACPDVALSVWHGTQRDLDHWFTSGLTDINLTFWPGHAPGTEVSDLPTDRLVLVSTDPASPLRFDPGYVLVEHGQSFSRDHAVAYADADTARLTFGTAAQALDHLLKNGGSAYLPLRLASPHLTAGRLHRLPDAPEFHRPAFLMLRTAACSRWDWFAAAKDVLLRPSH